MAPISIAVAALLVLGASTACGKGNTDEQRSVQPMPGKTITVVLREHTASLMSLAGVVGVGEGACAGRACIVVLVVERTPELLRQIPSAVEGYAVEVKETGEIKALPAK